MSTAAARIDVSLEDVECSVKITRPLIGASDVVWSELPSGVANVSAEATLYVFDDDDDGEPEQRVIARAAAYAIDLAQVGDLIDTFDRVGGEAFDIVESILQGQTIFDWLSDRDPLGGGGELISQLVIVESVVVDERYRGQRLGPRLLTTLVETVSGTGSETLIVLRATPVPWEQLSDIELRRSRNKVAASYESVGFEHFRHNIYWRHNAFIGTENLTE